MKNILLTLVLFVVITACNSDEPIKTDTIGTWMLIEQLADPGDGSGTFQPTDNTKILTLNADGTFEITGTLCQMSDEPDGLYTGTYDAEQRLLYPDGCDDTDYQLSYTLEGRMLIIYFPCIEPCAQKYEKADFILCR